MQLAPDLLQVGTSAALGIRVDVDASAVAVDEGGIWAGGRDGVFRYRNEDLAAPAPVPTHTLPLEEGGVVALAGDVGGAWIVSDGLYRWIPGGERGGASECATGSSPAVFDPKAGAYAVNVTEITPDGRTVSFDVVQWLVGQEAIDAYHEDHPEDPEGPPNDYYIANDSDEVRQAPVNPRPRCGSCVSPRTAMPTSIPDRSPSCSTTSSTPNRRVAVRFSG